MNRETEITGRAPHRALLQAALTASTIAVATLGSAQAQTPAAPATIKGTTATPAAKGAAKPTPAAAGQQAGPVATTLANGSASADSGPAEVGPSMNLAVGKSTLLRLPGPIDRISVGNPAVADVTLISSRELYLLGKNFGSTNVMMWRKGGPTTIIDVSVSVDPAALQQQLKTVLPEETGIQVQSAADSLVLTGSVTSALKAEYAVQVAESFIRAYSRGLNLAVQAGVPQAQQGQAIQVGQTQAGGQGSRRDNEPRVVNLLRVLQPQQVVIEVKVAEVNKTLLDKLGVQLNLSKTNGSFSYGIVSDLLGKLAPTLFATRGNDTVQIDAERKDGLIKILAEPNIVAISGQEASFLAGGKIFIPVSQAAGALGAPVITLEEKDYGVGLKFMPTVLDGGRINLKIAPEVSELSRTGSPFVTVNGAVSVLPSLTVRRAETTVQLLDGQSLAIAGLIQNNVEETIRRFPVLGEIPILGALFRSSEFKNDRTELMFIVTPRLVKPLAPGYQLPTDAFVPPSRAEFFLNGQMEGSGSPDVPADKRLPAPPAVDRGPAPPAAGGFQVK